MNPAFPSHKPRWQDSEGCRVALRAVFKRCYAGSALRSGLGCALPSLALLLIAGMLPATEAQARTYRNGEIVTISGRVTDADGLALPGVAVVLEVSRTRFRLDGLWKRGQPVREKSDTLRIPTVADAGGSYSFEWRWDGFYDVFELAVALPIREGGKETFDFFHESDVSEQVRAGNPVLVNLVVDDPGRLSWLRRFLSPDASDEERRVFDELGIPDRVDQEQRSDGFETSWWYFEHGKVYRFLDGALAEVQDFDPLVEP